MKSFMLDDLLRSIADAVMSAHKFMGSQHHDLSHLFRSSRAHPEVMEPMTMPLILPRNVVPEGEEPDAVHHVPLASLVPHQSTIIESLSMTFPCLIDGLQEGKDADSKRLSLVLGESLPNQHSRLATMTVTFRNSDPPEGLARINDQLLKRF